MLAVIICTISPFCREISSSLDGVAEPEADDDCDSAGETADDKSSLLKEDIVSWINKNVKKLNSNA